MKICGIKLTHDGAVSLIDDGKLIFCIEMEKINNNPRFTEIKHIDSVKEILSHNGYTIDEIDLFAVDGWGGNDQNELAIQPRLKIGKDFNFLSVDYSKGTVNLPVASYREKSTRDSLLKEWNFDDLHIAEQKIPYKSYLHATGHFMSTYCTSEFAIKNESAYLLIWDGGMFPRLYFKEEGQFNIENLGPIFLLIGNIYTIFSQHFGPFKVQGNFAKDDLSIAGKVMAYIAYGNLKEELFEVFDEIYDTCYDKPMGFANIFAKTFKQRIEGLKYKDEDILLTFHLYLERMLITKLRKKVQRHGAKSKNFCIAGGCALNIKWNSAIRLSGIFENVYVSPFPNDSGSALGAATTAMVLHDNRYYLEWNVYSGPKLKNTTTVEGWEKAECSLGDLAQLIAQVGEPIVFLDGNAELGPRALGNRSIIGAAVSLQMKDMLNQVKERESYRPVSPICMEEFAHEIFDPGISDPYMLFDHKVKKEWLSKIPAVIHLDKTARLQTVSEKENATFYQLLLEYYKLTGIPLLCNTSANYKGKGFFPDVYTASTWGKVNYVYSEKQLFTKIDKIPFPNKDYQGITIQKVEASKLQSQY